jgi:hypothetical protein
MIINAWLRSLRRMDMMPPFPSECVTLLFSSVIISGLNQLTGDGGRVLSSPSFGARPGHLLPERFESVLALYPSTTTELPFT